MMKFLALKTVIFGITASAVVLTSASAVAQRDGRNDGGRRRGDQERGFQERGSQDKGKLQIPDAFKQLMEKSRDLRFSGTRMVTVVRAGKVESHQEFVTKDGPNMRVEFAKDSKYAGQIIIETASFRRHYFPDRNEIKESPSNTRRQFELMRGMRGQRASNLKSAVGDGGSIAGIKALKMTMSDGDGNRVLELFGDARSGLILKRVVYDPTGSVAGSFEFKQVKFNPAIQASTFVLNRKGATYIRPIDELKRYATELGVKPYSFAEKGGMVLEGVNVRTMQDAKSIVQWFSMNDTRYTLFLTKADVSAEQLQRFGRGELKSVVWKLNGMTLVLMGMDSEESLRQLSKKVVDRSN